MFRYALVASVFICIILISGCIKNPQYYYTEGIVRHHNSLEDAFKECSDKCTKFIKQKFGENSGVKPTPKISECTEKECQCEC